MKRIGMLCAAMALLLTGCVRRPDGEADLPESRTDMPPAVSDTESAGTRNPVPVFPCSGEIKLASSDSSTLVFRADCYAESQNGQTAEVTVKVGITCWEISVGARTDGTVRVNGEEKTFSSPSLRYDTRRKTDFDFATLRFTVPVDPSDPVLHIDASWHFNGTYSGQPIGWLTVSGEIVLGDQGRGGD